MFNSGAWATTNSCVHLSCTVFVCCLRFGQARAVLLRTLIVGSEKPAYHTNFGGNQRQLTSAPRLFSNRNLIECILTTDFKLTIANQHVSSTISYTCSLSIGTPTTVKRSRRCFTPRVAANIFSNEC